LGYGYPPHRYALRTLLFGALSAQRFGYPRDTRPVAPCRLPCHPPSDLANLGTAPDVTRVTFFLSH